MKAINLATVIGFFLGFVVCACGDDGKLCERNETQPCACPGGGSGAQVCSSDGQGWEPCVCDGADMGGDVGTDADADADADAGPDVDDISGDVPIECGDPTLAQCQDAEWLENHVCGQAEQAAMEVDGESVCNQLLLDEAERLSEGYEEEEVVVPDELGGGTEPALIVPNPNEGLDEVEVPQTYTGHSQETSAEATESGLSAEEQALRAEWESNGNRVASCREYVHEKYYDYSLFEDAIAARHADFQYVADTAFGPSNDPVAIGTLAADGGTLSMRDGTDMTVQTLDSRVCYEIRDCYGGSDTALQNIFLAMPNALFQWTNASTSTSFNDVRMYLENDRCYDTCEFNPPLPWQWHLDRHAAALAAGFLDVEMDAMYPHALEFREALDDHDELVEASRGDCCPVPLDREPPSPGSYCDPYYAECVSLQVRLSELFDEAYEAGCVVSPMSSTATVCDWSPAYFVESLRASFNSAMEDDYQHCIDLTGDDFTALTDFVFYMPDESVWEAYPATDYTVTASSIDLLFDRQAEYRDALFDWYVDTLPSDLFNELTGEVRAPGDGDERSNNLSAGNDAFGVYLDYLFSWGLTNFDTESEYMPADMCLVGFESIGLLKTGGRVFWSDDVDIIDAYYKLSLASGESMGHFYILDNQLWNLEPAEEWSFAHSEYFPSDGTPIYEKDKVIRIEGIPVGRVFGGISGALGLNVGAEVTGGRNHVDTTPNGHVDPGETCTLDTSFNAYFTPWAWLGVYGGMGPYIEVAEAGIKVDLMLARLDVPFTLDISLATTDEMAGSVILDVTTNVDLELRTLDGRVSVYAKLGWGIFSVKWHYTLFRWTGLQWVWNLFHKEYPVPLGFLYEAMTFE